MFQRILIPLDGSRMAEAALPVALRFSVAFGSRVTLFHVIEKDAPREVHGEQHLNDPLVAEEYLRVVAAQFESVGIAVEIHVHEAPQDNVARSIAQHGNEFGVDLIVMCTHGSGGLKAFFFGRIAQQVSALSDKPVFFTQPMDSDFSKELSLQRLLVPLDGNADHEEALFVAEKFALTLQSELFLVMVVPEVLNLPGERAAAARLSPRVAREHLDLLQHDAQGYLDRHVMRLLKNGLSVKSAVLRGDPVAVISEAVSVEQVDVVILGTHGKTGLSAFWAGSATPQLSQKNRVPFLLVPVKGSSAGDKTER